MGRRLSFSATGAPGGGSHSGALLHLFWFLARPSHLAGRKSVAPPAKDMYGRQRDSGSGRKRQGSRSGKSHS